MIKPIHQHDCNKCKFIGVLNTVNGPSDLYRSCIEFGSKYILRDGTDENYITTNNLDIYLQPTEQNYHV